MHDRPATQGKTKHHAAGGAGFLPRLEALRGIAAASVLGYHVAGHYFTFVSTGMTPVVTFFVLSGFVLARALQNDPSIPAFVIGRIFRLVPPAAATVLLFAWLYRTFGFHVGFLAPFDATNVLLNALMIRHDINGVMWSMTVECLATPLILAATLTCQSRGPRPLWIACGVLVAISSWGPWVHLLGGFINLGPLYAFIAGVLVARRGAGLLESIPANRIRLLTLSALLLICFCGAWKQTAIIVLLAVIASAWLIAAIAFGPPQIAFAPLDSAALRFAGRISYSFYLLHMLGVGVALRLQPALPPMSPSLSALITLTVAVAVTTPLAWLFWRWIEMPAKQFGKRIIRLPQSAPVLSGLAKP